MLLILNQSKLFTRFLTFGAFLVIPSSPAYPQNQSFFTSSIPAQAPTTREDRVLKAIWQLPEVQRKAREIQRLSNGRVRVKLMVESEPTANEPYYTIRVFEDRQDRIATLYWFRVASPSGVITVQNEVTGDYISLEQWRKRYSDPK
ncbi:MAG TPA: hypothetical protein V6D28_23950 [Leptolyngbyaceae cyanobacterium]